MTASVGISAESVGIRFAKAAWTIRDLHCQIAPGEFVSIVGPSGCGKSTFLRMIAGLVSPSEGQLRFDAQSAVAAQRRVGFVFQEPTLLPWRTVYGNIRLPLELQGLATRWHPWRVGRALRLVGLSKQDAKKYPLMLSGGMKMRVSFARTLVTQPDVLLFDEPFAALDDILRQRLNEEILQLWQRSGWTAVFVTHNVSEAVFLSRRVLVMKAAPGSIEQEIEVPFAYPRAPELRSQPEFAQLCGQVSHHLRNLQPS